MRDNISTTVDGRMRSSAAESKDAIAFNMRGVGEARALSILEKPSEGL
ncbi:hypothetical protein [Paenarthrobacter nitroguajacolicus]